MNSHYPLETLFKTVQMLLTKRKIFTQYVDFPERSNSDYVFRVFRSRAINNLISVPTRQIEISFYKAEVWQDLKQNLFLFVKCYINLLIKMRFISLFFLSWVVCCFTLGLASFEWIFYPFVHFKMFADLQWQNKQVLSILQKKKLVWNYNIHIFKRLLIPFLSSLFRCF